MLEAGETRVDITYSRAVTREGSASARALVESLFEVCDRKWRGVGLLPKSGLRLRPELAQFDAEKKLDVTVIRTEESARCISGQVLRGLKRPAECPEFGRACTPETPLGATMVSAEGACAAYHRYRAPSLVPVESLAVRADRREAS
jgi:hydrogenase expression/formation protein HypD